jgi:hypothetical protein
MRNSHHRYSALASRHVKILESIKNGHDESRLDEKELRPRRLWKLSESKAEKKPLASLMNPIELGFTKQSKSSSLRLTHAERHKKESFLRMHVCLYLSKTEAGKRKSWQV